MADVIKITPQEVRDVAKNFADKAGELTEILQFLRSEVDRLEGTWDGAAQDAFFAMYDEMAKNMEAFPELVEGIHTQLNAVADTLEQTDEQIAASMGGR